MALLMKSCVAQSLLAFVVTSISTLSLAFEDHDAHEHGHASLMLVQEYDELRMIFKSPAMDIVGFEHQPGSSEQKAKVEVAEALLSDANELFVINAGAKCQLENVNVKSSLLEDKHGAHHDDDEETHNHHKEGVHSEFEVEYHFECASIEGLSQIQLNLFKSFPSLNEVEAQVITRSGQALVELDRHHEKILF